jgi:tetrahydromethanopterin S-methyltransferase subunit B
MEQHDFDMMAAHVEEAVEKKMAAMHEKIATLEAKVHAMRPAAQPDEPEKKPQAASDRDLNKKS